MKRTNERPSRRAVWSEKRERILLDFPFDKALIDEVKKIPGRTYHPTKKKKYWSCPLSLEAVNILDVNHFALDPHLIEYRRDRIFSVKDITGDIDIEGLGGTLFPFQAKGVSFIEARNGRALIGDEMGLGKTVQALAWLQHHPECRPAVIVCPASLKLNWKKEAEFWMSDPRVEVLNGMAPYKPSGDVLIINYSILKAWVDKLIEIDVKALVFDEAHYTKNSKSQRTKASKKLAKQTKHVIGLTGTAIVNRPVEIVNIVQMIDKTVIPNKWHFLHRYCNPKHNGFGWSFKGSSNTEELHNKLTSSVMIRRKKKDVLTDLPDKIRAFIPMELDNQSTYKKAENDFISYVKDQVEYDVRNKVQGLKKDVFGDVITVDEERLDELKNEKASKVNMLSKIEALKQVAVKGKLEQSISWIRDFLESDQKLVVMAVHKFVINELMKAFPDISVKVDGSVSGKDRDHAVRRFQTDPKCRLFVGNVQAAGVGLTLTAASNLVFLELPWTPGEVSQAEDRIHRIGQKESVTIHYLLAEGTIEEEIAELIDEKRKVLDAVLDGEETDQTSLLSELMSRYEN